MKEHKLKFIKRMSLFLLILIVSILVINTIYTKSIIEKTIVYRQDQSYKQHINSLTDKEIDFAFFGDSHAMDAANPQYIENSFNFAFACENYITIYYKLKKMLDDDVKINNIVLEIDLHTFSGVLTNEEGSFPRLFPRLWLFSDFVSYREIKEIRGDSYISLWLEANFPFIGKGDEFRFIIKKPELVNTSLGWVEQKDNFSEVENKFELATISVLAHFEKEERISDISFEYFIKTFELAEENNINIFFIKYLVSKEYDLAIVENNITKEDYYKTIFNEINKTIENYYVLDYYDIYFNNHEYFSDPDHLNWKGAEVLSQKLYADVNSANISK